MTYPTVDFFMVLDPLVPSSTENLNLFSIGFSAEFDFPCLYSNTCIVHLCSCRLFSYNILPISFCSNAPPHFCATVIRSLCLHSSYDIASCLYIYTQEYKLMQTELQVRHGGWEVHCLYRDHWMSVTGAIHKKEPTCMVVVNVKCPTPPQVQWLWATNAWELSMDFCEGQEEPCVPTIYIMCPFST